MRPRKSGNGIENVTAFDGEYWLLQPLSPFLLKLVRQCPRITVSIGQTPLLRTDTLNRWVRFEQVDQPRRAKEGR
jgi:hypothetical protein